MEPSAKRVKREPLTNEKNNINTSRGPLPSKAQKQRGQGSTKAVQVKGVKNHQKEVPLIRIKSEPVSEESEVDELPTPRGDKEPRSYNRIRLPPSDSDNDNSACSDDEKNRKNNNKNRRTRGRRKQTTRRGSDSGEDEYVPLPPSQRAASSTGEETGSEAENDLTASSSSDDEEENENRTLGKTKRASLVRTRSSVKLKTNSSNKRKSNSKVKGRSSCSAKSNTGKKSSGKPVRITRSKSKLEESSSAGSSSESDTSTCSSERFIVSDSEEVEEEEDVETEISSSEGNESEPELSDHGSDDEVPSSKRKSRRTTVKFKAADRDRRKSTASEDSLFSEVWVTLDKLAPTKTDEVTISSGTEDVDDGHGSSGSSYVKLSENGNESPRKSKRLSKKAHKPKHANNSSSNEKGRRNSKNSEDEIKISSDEDEGQGSSGSSYVSLSVEASKLPTNSKQLMKTRKISGRSNSRVSKYSKEKPGPSVRFRSRVNSGGSAGTKLSRTPNSSSADTGDDNEPRRKRKPPTPKKDLSTSVKSELRGFLDSTGVGGTRRKSSSSKYIQDPVEESRDIDSESDDSFIDNKTVGTVGNLESSSSSDSEVPEDKNVLDSNPAHYEMLLPSSESDVEEEETDKSQSDSDDEVKAKQYSKEKFRIGSLQDPPAMTISKCAMCHNLGDKDYHGRKEMNDASSWCKCDHCKVVSPRMENYDRICCKEILAVAEFMKDELNEDVKCITMHPQFGKFVLHYEGYLRSLKGGNSGSNMSSRVEWDKFKRATEKEKVIMCRYSFIRWIFNDVVECDDCMVVPACVGTKIRQKWVPSAGPLYFDPFVPKKTCIYAKHCLKARHHI